MSVIGLVKVNALELKVVKSKIVQIVQAGNWTVASSNRRRFKPEQEFLPLVNGVVVVYRTISKDLLIIRPVQSQRNPELDIASLRPSPVSTVVNSP